MAVARIELDASLTRQVETRGPRAPPRPVPGFRAIAPCAKGVQSGLRNRYQAQGAAMHRGVQWPEPTLNWPDGKLICCTFRVAYEAFRKSGRFKRGNKIDVNVTSLSHANYGGAVGIWRLMDL